MNTTVQTIGSKISLEALWADPYPIYRDLRAYEPVSWAPAAGRFLVTRFRDIAQIERDPETFSSVEENSLMLKAIGQTMLRLDGQEHKRIRAAVEPNLKRGIIRERWKDSFKQLATEMIERLAPRGEADLFHDFAGPYAAACLAQLIGFRGASEADIQGWSQAVIDACGNYGNDPEIWARSHAASQQIDDLLADVVPYLRQSPDDSILSAFANSSENFSMAEIKSNLMVILGGGVNEPRDALAVSVYGLLADPTQRAIIETDPSKWLAVFEEAIRWIAPVGMYPRQTTREVEIGGVTLPRGSKIGVLIASANRDETMFDNADVFDISRKAKPNLAFGGGAHFCLGAWAARVQVAEIALPLLFEKLPQLRLSETEPVRWGGWVFRGPLNLPVKWRT